MRILALDTSQIQCSVCLLDDCALVASRAGSVAVAHSEALLPLVHDLLRDAGVGLSDLDALAAGVGPGSFTGIRIGCATVKALAQVLDKPVLPLSSLRALALSGSGDPSRTVAMANAYQGQVFVGWPALDGWREDVMPADQWCREHLAGARGVAGTVLTFCGSGAQLCWETIRAEAARSGGGTLDAGAPYVNARGLAAAVTEKLAGRGSEQALVRYLDLGAHYMRPSQAEIKLESGVAKGKGA